MNELGKNVVISLLLGGLWALLVETILSTLLYPVNLTSIIYYPLLFTGFIFISTFYFDIDIKLFRILLTGFASGLGYYFFSAYFPLLSILFIAFILALGLTAQHGSKADLLTIFLKGSVCIPLGIFITDLFIQFSGILIKPQILSWLILGAVINICFMITIIPISRLLQNKSEKTGDPIYRKDDIDDFRSQTRDIIKDLNSIHTN